MLSRDMVTCCGVDLARHPDGKKDAFCLRVIATVVDKA